MPLTIRLKHVGAVKMRTLALVSAAFGLLFVMATPALGQGVPVKPGVASTYDFASASQCVCHDALSAQWRDSVHAISLYDPVFRAKVAQAQAEAGSAVSEGCLRCHSPIGNMVNDPTGQTSVGAAEGVTCMFCHQTVGDTGVHANVSQLLVPDNTRRAQLQNPVAPHKAAYEAYLHTSEFCGDCHQVIQPVTGVVLDSTYTEWAKSTWAKDGVSCQDCHMSTATGGRGPSSGKAASSGPKRDDMYGMTFIGANVAQGPADASTAMLQRAASVQIEAPSVVAPGDTANLKVTVFNVGAGHDLPTGSSERNMWLSVSATDANGRSTQLGTKRFGTVFMDAQGKHPVEVWNGVAVYSNTRIPPHGSAVVSVPFTMPLGVDAETVVAAVQYQSLPDDLAAKGNVGNPTTLMASATKRLYANEVLAKQMSPQLPVNVAPPVPASIWTTVVAGLAMAGLVLLLSVALIVAQRLR